MHGLTFLVDLFCYCGIIKKSNKEEALKMFKICALGCGWMSTSGHGPSFKKYFEDYKDVELSACCDLDEEKVKHTRKNLDFRGFIHIITKC